jgi:hypothetical protein
MWFDDRKRICGVVVAGILATVTLGCAPSQLAEPEPLPETIVHDLTARENALWNTFKEKDGKRLAGVLADEYVAVGDRGPMNKAAMIAYVDDRNISEYSVRDVRATLLGSNYVLLTYACNIKGDRHASTFNLNYLCSDIWVRRGGTWQSIFFEDRPIAERKTATLSR